MSEITHADYMRLVERIEKLEAFMKRELSRQPITAQPARLDTCCSPATIPGDPHDVGVRRDAYEQLIQALERRNSGETKCFFETLSPEDRYKPMGISCPCRKCSPYSMGG